MSDPAPLMLFDGVCNLCTASVRFMIARNRSGTIKFASMQSAMGQSLLKDLGLSLDQFDSFIFIEDGIPYQQSQAVLRVGRNLSLPWKLASIAGTLIPRSFADRLYMLVARRRYRLFGERQLCMILDPSVASHFLDQA